MFSFKDFRILELNVFLIVMCMSHPQAPVGVNYIYICYINIGHTVASKKCLQVTAGCTTASMVMWPTAETCDVTLLSSPSRLWLTWCLSVWRLRQSLFSVILSFSVGTCAIFVISDWFKSECFAWDSWSFRKYSITIITNTNHKKVPLLWKKLDLLKVMAQHFHICL